jgi:hypothetical protein
MSKVKSKVGRKALQQNNQNVNMIYSGVKPKLSGLSFNELDSLVESYGADYTNKDLLKQEKKNILFVKKLNSENELKEHAIQFAKNIHLDNVPISTYNRHYTVCSTILASCKKTLNESKHISGGKEFVSLIKKLDQFDKLDIKVGSKVAVINSQLQGDSVELWGFTTPKTITKIYRDMSDQTIKQFEFNDDPNDVWPRTENAEYNGHFLMYSAFFKDKKSAEHAITLLTLQTLGDFIIRRRLLNENNRKSCK